jgi:hypothetical protein
MIRFVDLGCQIDDGIRYFAWFDTITDKFMIIGDEHIFDSWEDFEVSWKCGARNIELERFKSLFPKNWGK